MIKTVLLVFCGLPGSGKTTMCQLLSGVGSSDANCRNQHVEVGNSSKFTYQNFHCFHVCYDVLLPKDIIVSMKTNPLSNNDEKQWKYYRQQIVKCVKGMLCHMLQLNNFTKSDDAAQEIIDNFCQSVYPLFETKPFSTERNVLTLIDDNMFYRSMRYEFFQLARELNIGFGQVFINCPLTIALKQNFERNKAEQVPAIVIEDMSRKLEMPSSDHWESNSVIVMYDKLTCKDTVLGVMDIVEKAWENPVKSLPSGDDLAATNESRSICSKSLRHQSDLILRQLVSQHVKNAPATSKPEMQEVAKTLGKVKAEILSGLESGCISLDILEENIAGSSKDPASVLYVQITKMFQQKIEGN